MLGLQVIGLEHKVGSLTDCILISLSQMLTAKYLGHDTGIALRANVSTVSVEIVDSPGWKDMASKAGIQCDNTMTCDRTNERPTHGIAGRDSGAVVAVGGCSLLQVAAVHSESEVVG